MFASLKKMVVAAGLMVGLMTAGAQASEYGYGGYVQPQPAWSWKTITVYQTVEQPVVSYVTKYRECGTPYQARVVGYKLVKVPVQKRIKVYH